MVIDIYIVIRKNRKLGKEQVFEIYKVRFKSLIHKIYKEEDDDDVEELTAIKIYLSK